MSNKGWANFICDRRKTMQLTRRKLAQLANIDPSYVTLIERYGYIPRKNKVLDLAKALKTCTDQTLIMAGYAPDGISFQEFLERVEVFTVERSLNHDLREILKELSTLPETEQKNVASLLNAYLEEARKRQVVSRKK